jgi:hypothetical protein
MSWSTARKNRARDNARRLGEVQRTVERWVWSVREAFTKILDTRYGGWILAGAFFLALGFIGGAIDKL